MFFLRVFFSFICASPYLLIKPFGLSMVDYGWLIALNGMGIVLVGFFSAVVIAPIFGVIACTEWFNGDYVGCRTDVGTQ